MESGGRGGWVHVSDQRNLPDYGRIAWPEDIFGSLEVDGQGNFVDRTGRYQSSGTYRMVTRDGILGLTPFLREMLVQRLKVEKVQHSQLNTTGISEFQTMVRAPCHMHFLQPTGLPYLSANEVPVVQPIR